MKTFRLSRALLLVAILACVVAFTARLNVSAHEERKLGKYNVELGWRVEPAAVGVMNGPDVYVSFADKKDAGSDPQKALEALKIDLQVEVTLGPAKKTIKLEQNYPYYSEYEGTGEVNLVGSLLPTRPGDYTFHLTGTIEDVKVDEKFTSADGKFGTVEPAADILFPDTNVDAVSLQQQIDALKAEIDALKKK